MLHAIELPITDFIKTGRFENAYFLSPHLDDAVLSNAQLISTLSNYMPVTVVSIFCGDIADTEDTTVLEYIKKRRQEDQNALKELDCVNIQLSFTDGLYRQKEGTDEYIYPNKTLYGGISPYDTDLISKLLIVLQHIISNKGNALVISPLGVGNHVDHLIVREVTKLLPTDKNAFFYYADFPYLLKKLPNNQFVFDGVSEALQRIEKALQANDIIHEEMFSFEFDVQTKGSIILHYASQIQSLFGSQEKLETLLAIMKQEHFNYEYYMQIL